MNQFFVKYVALGRRLASEKGLSWELKCDAEGRIERSEKWNASALAGLPPPFEYLSSIGTDRKLLEPLNAILEVGGQLPIDAGPLPDPWVDLLKAAVLNEILVKRNKPGHALDVVGRQLRILATCAREVEPWEITGEHVQLAYNAALQVGGSGKLASNLESVVRTVLDAGHLTDRGPLARFCKPFETSEALAAQERVKKLRQSNNENRGTASVRKELHERKAHSKLPDERAFWEMVRIVFTEQPRTFGDAIRFAQLKLAIVTGFRVGELVTLPLDWRRKREYVDPKGRPAGERGGVSSSLMIRYFAEKQHEAEGAEGVVLYENGQHVPPMFEGLLEDVLTETERLTARLRHTLRRQTETGRLLPDFDPRELISAVDLHVRSTGSVVVTEEPAPSDLVRLYRETYDPAVLDEIRDHQKAALRAGAKLTSNVRKYFGKFLKQGLPVYHSRSGFKTGDTWAETYFRVGEFEDFFRRAMPTKVSDTLPFKLSNGDNVFPWQLMFLMPARALIEERNGGIVDVTRYMSVGRVSIADLNLALGDGETNLFTRYGETEADRQLNLDMHSLRHLQNTELFRLGVADSIITKRFGRRSVAQSHIYDHRSLAEDLASIELPAESVEIMGPKAQQALQLIMSNKVSGPLVEEFRRIQRELGDDVAFSFLDAEADGMHVTPYGFCLNSFMVDPCPKHLECFNGCLHLVLSPIPEDRATLQQLRDRFTKVILTLEASPPGGVGRTNQLAHARTRLANIERALTTAPGEHPFPDGRDLSQPFSTMLGSTVIDGAKGTDFDQD